MYISCRGFYFSMITQAVHIPFMYACAHRERQQLSFFTHTHTHPPTNSKQCVYLYRVSSKHLRRCFFLLLYNTQRLLKASHFSHTRLSSARRRGKRHPSQHILIGHSCTTAFWVGGGCFSSRFSHSFGLIEFSPSHLRVVLRRRFG